jgi:hemolysin activation/secretion protein
MFAPGVRAEPPAVTATTSTTLPALAALVFLDDPSQVLAIGAPQAQDIELRGDFVPDPQAFKARMRPHLGKPLDDANRAEIVGEVARYFREAHALVDVILPPQEITGGVLQVLVLRGKVGQIRVEGGRWFDPAQLAERLSIRPGQAVDSQRLGGDIDWLNRNPFRQVDLVYAKGAGVGETDLVLVERDRFPLRLSAGYDDSGTPVTGNDRLNAAINWGNLFGGDGLFSYQYTVDPAFKWFKAHSASITQPLPWRHVLTVFGSYADIRGNVPPPFDLDGFNWQTSARYEIPLPKAVFSRFVYQEAATLGLDFKRSNNNLAFGGEQVFGSLTDALQWNFGYNANLKDPWGGMALRALLVYSPGHWTSNQSDAAYQRSRAGATARYAYLNLQANRTTSLPFGLALITQVVYQKSDSNLLATEQIGFGGFDTIRGYDTRVVNADQGVIFSNELRTPPVSPLAAVGLKKARDSFQVLGFLDHGSARNRDLLMGEFPRSVLTSSGVGLRYAIASNFSLRADYGWQLRRLQGPRPYPSRAHLGVTVSL